MSELVDREDASDEEEADNLVNKLADALQLVEKRTKEIRNLRDTLLEEDRKNRVPTPVSLDQDDFVWDDKIVNL